MYGTNFLSEKGLLKSSSFSKFTVEKIFVKETQVKIWLLLGLKNM